METSKHLDILDGVISITLCLSILGTGICLIAWISGEGAILFIIFVLLSLGLYLAKVFIRVIIDFYDAVVIKNKISNTKINVIDDDIKTTDDIDDIKPQE